LETAILVAFIAVGITAVSSIVDFIQTYHIRKVQNKLNEVSEIWEEGGSVGDQFGKWLLAKEAPDKPTNLEACASLVGHQIASSFSMGLKGIASGESRTLRSVERQVMESLEDPQVKQLLDYCDRAGIPRELAGTAYDILQKRGYLDKLGLGKNDGEGSKALW
jgi:hypothetical protein